MLRCCAPKEASTGPKPLSDRRCTDILCLLLFALFWGGLVAIFTVVWSTGDTMSLFYDADYLGDRCGVGALKNRTKAYYPRMADDLLEQRAYLLAGAVWNIKLYTLWCAAAAPPPLLRRSSCSQGAQRGPRCLPRGPRCLPRGRVLNAPSPCPQRTLTVPSPHPHRALVACAASRRAHRSSASRRLP